MIEYREITKADDAVIAGIIRDNLKKYRLDIPGTVYFDEGLDHLSDHYGVNGRKYFVIEDDQGKVIGGIGFAKVDFMNETAELQKLYLDDRAKGAGLGYELIALVEKEMSAAGYKYSYLETHDNLNVAIHLYEKCGYIEIDRPAEVVHSAMNRFFRKALGAILASAVLLSGCAGMGEKGAAENANETLADVQENSVIEDGQRLQGCEPGVWE